MDLIRFLESKTVAVPRAKPRIGLERGQCRGFEHQVDEVAGFAQPSTRTPQGPRPPSLPFNAPGVASATSRCWHLGLRSGERFNGLGLQVGSHAHALRSQADDLRGRGQGNTACRCFDLARIGASSSRSGQVSFSNPVRQSLFTHRDAAEGRQKATAAREAVEAILPDAEVEDVPWFAGRLGGFGGILGCFEAEKSSI